MIFHQMRIARPVSCLETSCKMYCAGMGLKKIAEFTQHAGFSGCMLGRDDLAWHLEFTLCDTHPIIPSPSSDDLLVIYIRESSLWQAACLQMEKAGFETKAAFNPYWDVKGRTFVDNDGYRTVMQNGVWPPADY